MSVKKDVKALRAEVEALAFVCVRQKGHAYVYHHPKGGVPLHVPKTPSDRRAVNNTRAKAHRILRGLNGGTT